MGDGTAEASSAIGDGGQAAISLTPYVIGHVNSRSHLWNFTTWMFTRRGLTDFKWANY